VTATQYDDCHPVLFLLIDSSIVQHGARSQVDPDDPQHQHHPHGRRLCRPYEPTVHHHRPHLSWRNCHHEAVRRPANHLLVSSAVHIQSQRIHRVHLLGRQYLLPANGKDDPRRTAGHAAHKLLPVGSAGAAVSVVDHVHAVPFLALLQPAFWHQRDRHHGCSPCLIASVLYRKTRKGCAPIYHLYRKAINCISETSNKLWNKSEILRCELKYDRHFITDSICSLSESL